MKKLIALLLIFSIAVSMLSGCGIVSSSEDSPDTPPKTELTMGIIGTHPISLSKLALSIPQEYCTLVYQQLFHLNSEKELIPVIAESYEQIDPLTYRVKLKENVYDSAGNHITVDDVIVSLDYSWGGGSALAHYSPFDIPYAKISDYEMEFYFVQETSFAFLNIATHENIFDETVVNEIYSVNSDKFEVYIGTGPYVIESFTENEEIVLVPNENYWWDDPHELYAQNMEKITIRQYDTQEDLAAALKNGEVDIVSYISPTDLAALAEEGFQTDVLTGCRTEGLYINCSEYSVLQNKKLRQAVAYAIDTEEMAETLNMGFYEPAASIVRPSHIEWPEEYENRVLYKQDIEKAKQLVAELKAEGVNPSFSIMARDDEVFDTTAVDMIAEYCSAVGINVTVEKVKYTDFLSRYGNLEAYDAYIYSSTSKIYFTESVNTHIDRTGYPNPSRLRDVLAVAFRSDNENANKMLIELWDEEIPILPLLYENTGVVYTDGLTGIEYTPFPFYRVILYPAALRWE